MFIKCEKSFYIPFQSQSKGAYSLSTDEWIEFNNEIPDSRELTSCQWIRTKYFNVATAFQLWSYCTIESANDTMTCLELFLDRSETSANRNVIMKALMKYRTSVFSSVEVKNFLHRTWVYLCFTTSSITDKTEFYFNGNYLGSGSGLANSNNYVLRNSTERYDSALIFGQEPDKIRGDYDPFQAFIGDLAELNIWNYVLNSTEIMDMAQCKNWRKGNVISWEKKYITIHNVEAKDLENSSALCNTQKKLVIFPKMVTFSQAKDMCRIHGGNIAVPTSKTESSEMINIVMKHKEKCIAKRNATKNMVTWIGTRKRNKKWY